MKNPVFLSFQFPNLNKVKVYFGTRIGGQSKNNYSSLNLSLEVGDDSQDVLSNRRLVKNTLQLKYWLELKQVHGDKIHLFTQQREDFFSGPELEGDGLFTTQSKTGLLIKTADCQPLFFTDKKQKFIGALHCGWRGNALNFPQKGLKFFIQNFKLSPQDVLVVRGPSLGPCCAEFKNYKDYWPQEFWPYFSTEEKINLWQLTQEQIKNTGITEENIFSLDICTRCNSHLFFSYRRNKNCGRLGNFIVLVN